MTHFPNYLSASPRARLEDVVAQIDYIVHKTTGTTHFQRILTKGIVENMWISRVVVAAVHESNRIWAQIEVRVDWKRLSISLNGNGKRLAADKHRPPSGQISETIIEVVEWFNDITFRNGLIAEASVIYFHQITRNDQARANINEQLGLGITAKRPWAKGKVRELPVGNSENGNELKARLRAVY